MVRSLPSNESANISPVLSHQRVGIVFRVALKKNEEALLLFDENVYRTLGGRRENPVTVVKKATPCNAIPPRMWDAEADGRPCVNGCAESRKQLKTPKFLASALDALNTIHMQDAAWAARQDHTVECVLPRAHSRTWVKSCQ